MKPAFQQFPLDSVNPDFVVVGDDVENDVGGAQAAGLSGILVRTGKFREELLRRAEIAPNAVIGSIADLPALLSTQ